MKKFLATTLLFFFGVYFCAPAFSEAKPKGMGMVSEGQAMPPQAMDGQGADLAAQLERNKEPARRDF